MRYATIYFTIFLLLVCAACSRRTLQSVTESRTSLIETDTMLVTRMMSLASTLMSERAEARIASTSAVTVITDSTVVVKDTEGRVMDFFHWRDKSTVGNSVSSTDSKVIENLFHTVSDTSAVSDVHRETAEKNEEQSVIKVAETPLSIWERIKDMAVWITALSCVVAILSMVWLIHRKT